MKFPIKNLAIEFNFECFLKGTKRVNFYREFYGWKNFSNNGKYVYIKEGVLSDIKHIRPTRSTIIVRIENAGVVRNYLKKHGCIFDERIIFLNKKDAQEFGIKFENAWEKIISEIKGNSPLYFNIDL